MDYEKKYKEALERARIWQNHLYDTNDKDYANELNYIFPELAESEDEKIRKALIRFHKSTIEVDGIKGEDIIAWLEKQGEQKPANSYCQENCKGFQETGKCFADGDCKAKREAESNDKNEPKFHEGDWVIYNNDICQIVKREEGCNILVTQFGVEKEPVNERNLSTAKLWDIFDAKNGDVLVIQKTDVTYESIFIFKEIKDTLVIQHCHYLITDTKEEVFEARSNNGFLGLIGNTIHPAPKEQRDLLFAKMKEAGYEWDSKKKELKKIRNEITIPFGAKDSELQEATYYIPKGFHAEIDDDKVVIKKGEKLTAWIKKDEKMFKYALNMIEWYSGKNEDKSRYVSDWLKSLKQRIGG